jgi:GDP-D-mannose 3',5'-epimerase
VTGLVEKPSAADVPSRLGVFGRYLLEPAIWDAIDKTDSDARGEVQLTDALNLLSRTNLLFGLCFEGQHYDAGDPLDYLQASIELAFSDPHLGQPVQSYLSRVTQRCGNNQLRGDCGRLPSQSNLVAVVSGGLTLGDEQISPRSGDRMTIQGQKVVVSGAGGFIGGHLVKSLAARGAKDIRAVDIKPLDEWYQKTAGVENLSLDLKEKKNCYRSAEGAHAVFQLAADMGGMGFIENNRALCMLSVLTNTHMLMASKDQGVKRFFYASSACVYNGEKQVSPDVIALKEEDAYPALPEDGYGWEKLFSERMCRHFEEDFGLECRVARFHNVYGPHGTWDGGREKAPAAICRKVIEAKRSGKHEIEIWGDGNQTRSFMYIDDCTRGVEAIFESDIHEPINLGSSELVTINQLVDIVEEIAGIRLKRNYNLNAPKGVNGRNSDNTKIKQYLGWEPSIRLKDGMERTYAWIESEMLTLATR